MAPQLFRRAADENTTSLIIGVVVAAVALVFIFIGLAIAFVKHRRKRQAMSSAVAHHAEQYPFRHPQPDPKQRYPADNTGMAPLLEKEEPEAMHTRETSYDNDPRRASILSYQRPAWVPDEFLYERVPRQEVQDPHVPSYPYLHQNESLMQESQTPVSSQLPRPSAPTTATTNNYTAIHPVATIEPTTATPVSADSPESEYSQLSASTTKQRHVEKTPPPPVPPIPRKYLPPKTTTKQPLRLSDSEEEEEEPALIRGNTRVLGNMLKKRAKRAKREGDRGASLHRSGTQVSQIERSGSIKSVPSPDVNESSALPVPKWSRRNAPTIEEDEEDETDGETESAYSPDDYVLTPSPQPPTRPLGIAKSGTSPRLSIFTGFDSKNP